MTNNAQRRVVDDVDYRKTIIDWLTANGIDAADVPIEARASVTDGQLTIPLRVRDAAGRHIVDPNEPKALLAETVTVPVKVKPNSDVDLWLAPRCEACGR